MSSNSISGPSEQAIVEALRRQLTSAVARETVAASNIANLDTPGYRTRELSFADALDLELNGYVPLRTTDQNHLSGTATAAAAGEAQDVEGLPARRDGNNVQLDRELLALGRAAGDFSSAQTALSAKFRLIRYAINDGR